VEEESLIQQLREVKLTVSDVPTGFVNSLEKTIVEKKKLKLEQKKRIKWRTGSGWLAGGLF
jgi:hypothetical protein